VKIEFIMTVRLWISYLDACESHILAPARPSHSCTSMMRAGRAVWCAEQLRQIA